MTIRCSHSIALGAGDCGIGNLNVFSKSMIGYITLTEDLWEAK